MSYYSLISLMPKATGFDPDAQAFITAAAITNPTQQAAINTLVVSLKGYNIWTKFNAIYPIVGGSASSHKYNLKDPRDLDAAFRLTFGTGWTHSANGMTPTNTFANTFLNANSILTQNSTHISYYSRTNSNATEVEMGGLSGGTQLLLEIRTSNVTYFVVNMAGGYPTYSDSDSRGFYVGNRTASNVVNGWKTGVKVASNTTASSTPPNFNLYLGAYNNGGGSALLPTTKQCAFASIGDGLTDTEAANFYTAVQAFQTTLGRSIGTQTVSDADAQAFINAAAIDDQVQADAINNLVIGMKADGLWTKMKAIYPICGGNASSHAVNLKTPGTFNLNYATGVTHSANGMVGNGSTGYANTNLQPFGNLLQDSTHYSFYSRTNTNTTTIEMGVGVNSNIVEIRTSGVTYHRVNGAGLVQHSDANSLGFYTANRTASLNLSAWKNGVKLASNTSNLSEPLVLGNIFILALNNGAGVGQYYSTKECAFASIGDGLTDTEAANFYTRVNTYQTALSRNV